MSDKYVTTVWDTEMITKLAGPFTPESISSWTSTILREFTFPNGLYRNALYKWVACHDDVKNAEVRGCFPVIGMVISAD